MKIIIRESNIADALWIRLRERGHQWMCPRFTPLGYFECDMISITKSGFFVEHEIKLSVSDFRADAKKSRDVWNGKFGESYQHQEVTKHTMIQKGEPHMKTKLVKRHYCDHCGRGALQRPAMERHEAHCYKNPIRACFRCEAEQTDVAKNAEVLLKDGVEKLARALDHCPDCILAAHVWANKGLDPNDPDDRELWLQFDYKAARKEWDDEKNSEFRAMCQPFYMP